MCWSTLWQLTFFWVNKIIFWTFRQSDVPPSQMTCILLQCFICLSLYPSLFTVNNLVQVLIAFFLYLLLLCTTDNIISHHFLKMQEFCNVWISIVLISHNFLKTKIEEIFQVLSILWDYLCTCILIINLKYFLICLFIKFFFTIKIFLFKMI